MGVHEVGETLRRARIERGLELDAIERETLIRSRYLVALEDGELARLPGAAYARSFLREYAQILGLDPKPLLDRLGDTADEPQGAAALLEPVETPPRRLRLGRLALVPVAAAVAVIVIAFWPQSSDVTPPAQKQSSPSTPAGAEAATPPKRAAGAATTTATTPTAPARPPLLRLTAARGDCWVEARADSPDGRLLYEGTIDAGDSIQLRHRAVWMRLGAPWNLDLRVAGKPAALPDSPGDPLDLLVTKDGVQPAG